MSRAGKYAIPRKINSLTFEGGWLAAAMRQDSDQSPEDIFG